MLDLLGVGSDRVEMFYCSAAEGAKFAEIVRELTKKITEMGPNPLKAKEKAPAEAEGTS